ncbi:MAG: efflux RND transporter periplasmic adaptor subunit, partial [bacterium]
VNISNVVTFEVKLEVLGEEKYLLKPEMTANVKIITAEEDDVLLIPIDAVLRRQGEPYVEVVNQDGNIMERSIETGIDNGEKIRVINGLEEGEEIKVNKEDTESRWSNSPGRRTLSSARRMRRR